MLKLPPQGRKVGVNSPRAALTSVALFAILSVASVSAVSAQSQNGQGQNGSNQGQGNGVHPLISATPELDSLLLFGSGIAGVVGYAALRRRARR